MRGIHKFWTTYIFETLFLFLIEMLIKFILGTFSFDYSILRIFLSSALISFLLTIITTNLPLKLRRALIVIIDFVVTLYSWIQLGLNNFLGGFMSIGNAEQGTKTVDYIGEFLLSFTPQIYLVIIPFILIILYLIFERYITKDGFEKKIPFSNLLYTMAGLVYMALLGFGFYVTIEAPFMQNRLQTVSNKNLFRYPSSPGLAIKNYGATVYLMLDIKSTITGNQTSYNTSTPNKNKDTIEEDKYTRKIDDEAWLDFIKVEENADFKTLNNYFINREITPKNEYTGKFEGKNLIMIMMESIGLAVFDEQYKDYFPTLYKLYKEGMTSTNNYSPRNNCATGDSEMTSQISLYATPTSCTVNTYKNNEYKEALLYKMRNSGYYTSAYHDYTDQYYYRSTYEYKFGAYRYYGVSDLGMTYNPAYKEWTSDLTFMKQAMPKFIDQKRFASYMITVSAHTPYIYSSEMGNKHMSLFKDTSFTTPVKRYLSKVKELDLALETLLEELESRGILDDTVIVLFGDHYPYGLSDKEYQSLATYSIKDNQEIDRTPFIIYNSETPSENISKFMTPMDYAPTLLNLFGIDYDPRVYLGHDVWSDYTDYAVFPDNSWQGSLGFYDASKGEFFPREGSTYKDEDIITINNEIADMRSMSTLAMKKDYFNHLYKYFEEYEKLKKTKEEAIERPKDPKESTEETEE